MPNVDRRAAALRENLRKRKLQAEMREQGAGKQFPLPSREGSGEGE